MGYASKEVHNHLVYYDADESQRWLDVIGPNVVKHIFDGVEYMADLYTVTAVNGSTIALVDSTLGGEAVFTSDTAENDGVQAQLLGEAFYLDGTAYPCYFGCRFKCNDVDQVDAFVGLSIQDTTVIGGDTCLGFRTADESATVEFLAELDAGETTASLGTMTDDTYIVVEFYYDGANVEYWLNGASVGTMATTDTNMPDDEHMSPVLAMLTGEGAANTMTVDWARWFQIQE